MIVACEREESVRPRELLARIEASRARMGARPALDDATELLLACGELESAVADALSPSRDEPGAAETSLAELTLAAAALHARVWRGQPAGREVGRIARALEVCALLDLPAEAPVRPRERLERSGVHPEPLSDAAEAWGREIGGSADGIVVIGLRAAGSALAAVVAAALEDESRSVVTHALRARDGGLRLGPGLESALREGTGPVALVDGVRSPAEPSPLHEVAGALSRLGIADARLTLFPATGGSRHGRWTERTTSFEDSWLASGRLLASEAPSSLEDWSAGRWRSHLTLPERPPALPRWERRKLVVTRDGSRVMHRFAGLGADGRHALELAQGMAAHGPGPAAHGLVHGHLVLDHVAGAPMTRAEADQGFVRELSRYVAWRATLRTGEPVPFDALLRMIRENVAAALGPVAAGRAARLEALRAPALDGAVVLTDGRMQPHEWLRTRDGFVKTDGIDHHDDGFFPGRQDVAWDVAGVGDAWGDEVADAVVERLAREDAGLGARMPLYRVAHAAWRWAFATWASAQVDGEDAAPWRAEATHLVARLTRALERA